MMMMMHLMIMTPSLALLLLAAPSMASSFVATSSVAPLSQQPQQQYRYHHTLSSMHSQQRFFRVFAIPAGGSSSSESEPPPAANDEGNMSPPPQPEDVESVAPPPPPPVAATASASVAVASSLMGPNATTPGALRKTFATLPWHRLPNILTYIRCLAIPGLVALFYMPNSSSMACGILFGLASLTDYLDGYLARRWDITSPFGAFLDPVADKLMVSTSLILLAGRYGKLVVIPSLIILAREISVSALREWMAQRGERDVVKVGMQGKVKTALTMFGLTLLLLVPAPDVVDPPKLLAALYQPSLVLLYLSAVVTVTSGSVYFRAAGPALLGK